MPDSIVFVAGVVLFGLVVGSFLNVVIHRLPRMVEREWREDCAELLKQDNSAAAAAPVTAPDQQPQEAYNLVVPRSRCPSCGRMVRAIENIPVVSYLLLGGRCAGCKSKISLRYPLVEIVSAVAAVLCVWRFGVTLAAAGAMVFVFSMIALFFIDLDTFYLPDQITLPLLWAGLLFNLADTHATLPAAVIGGAAGYLSLWSVYHAYKFISGKEGMGYGDFKLLGAIGAWLGWQLLPQVILLSSVVGAVVGVALMIFARHGRDTPIPFGPYLAAAGVIALFYGQGLNQLYLGRF